MRAIPPLPFPLRPPTCPPTHFRRARTHESAASRTYSQITHPPRSHTLFITASLCCAKAIRCSQPRRQRPLAGARGSAEMRALRRGRGHIGRALHSRRTCSRSARKLATNCVLSKLRTLTRPLPRPPARSSRLRSCPHAQLLERSSRARPGGNASRWPWRIGARGRRMGTHATGRIGPCRLD